MSFIIGVLILGALLSTIFGKRVGALFVVGTATVALIPLAILVFGLLAIVIGMMMTPDHPQQSASHSQSYGSSSAYASPTSSYAPAEGSASNYAPATQPYSAPSQAYAAPSQAYAAPPSGRQTEVYCPRLGLYLKAGPQDWSALKITPGAGIQVTRLELGSPGDIGKLQPGDVLVNLDGKYFHMLHSPSELNELLDESGAGVPVRVFYERPGGGKGSGGQKTLLPQ